MSSGNGVNGTSGHGELVFEDEDLVPSAMRTINMMRKNKHFCDVVLHVRTHKLIFFNIVHNSIVSFRFDISSLGFDSCMWIQLIQIF